MEEHRDWFEPDLLIRIYILVCIVILATIIISPHYHPITLALVFILSVLGHNSVIIPITNQIKQRRRQEAEEAKRVQRDLLRNKEGIVLKERGIGYYLNGHYNDAIKVLRESVHFNSYDAESQKYLGLSYLTLNRYEDALECLKRALRINPDDADVNAQIARIESQIEFKRSVRRFYNVKDKPRPRNTWRLPGEAKSEKMMRRINRNLKIEQERASRAAEARNYFQHGKIHVDLQRYDEALKYYKRSLYIQQDLQDYEGEVQSHFQIGVLYRLLQRCDEALKHFTASMAIEQKLGNREGEARILSQIGLTYQEMGQWDEAIEYYNQLLAVQQELNDHAGRGETLHQIGLIYQKMYRDSEALNFFNQSLEIAREVEFKELEMRNLEQIEVIRAKTNSELS